LHRRTHKLTLPPMKKSDTNKDTPAGCVKQLVSRSFWTCLLCGRSKFTWPGQPHRCLGGTRKRFKAEAKRRGLENAFIPSANVRDQGSAPTTNSAEERNQSNEN
jgi:hypothetical protein